MVGTTFFKNCTALFRIKHGFCCWKNQMKIWHYQKIPLLINLSELMPDWRGCWTGCRDSCSYQYCPSWHQCGCSRPPETKKQRRSIMSSLVIGRAKRVICRVHQTGLQFNDIRGASHASTRRFSVSQSKNRTSFKPYSSLKHTKHPPPPQAAGIKIRQNNFWKHTAFAPVKP